MSWRRLTAPTAPQQLGPQPVRNIADNLVDPHTVDRIVCRAGGLQLPRRTSWSGRCAAGRCRWAGRTQGHPRRTATARRLPARQALPGRSDHGVSFSSNVRQSTRRRRRRAGLSGIWHVGCDDRARSLTFGEIPQVGCNLTETGHTATIAQSRWRTCYYLSVVIATIGDQRGRTVHDEGLPLMRSTTA